MSEWRRRAICLATLVQRYRDEATGHLAATTQEDRKSQLKSNGRILRPRGHLRLDEITRKRLLEWWTYEVINAGLSPKTGRNYLDAISAVPSYGRP